MAKNQPIKNIPQSKQPQATVRSTNKQKPTSEGGWFRFPSSQNTTLLFDKTNYVLMGFGVFLIITGFMLMSGGNTDPKVFNEAEIYSFQRITLAPIMVISGFLVIVVAILKKPASSNKV